MYIVPILVTALLTGEPNITVKNITLKKPEYDSFAEVLHITQASGTVELSDAASVAAFIEIDVYRKGKKLPTVLGGLGSSDGTSKGDRIRFAANVIDMDYLTLGDGKKDHCRLQLKVSIGNPSASTTLDVPKKECDFSKMTLVNDLGLKEVVGSRIPVCWMINPETASLITAGKPLDLVKANPNADMAIVYIRFQN
jgi:hypothetical protein